MKYTLGLLNCEIDIIVSDITELNGYIQDPKVLYITDEHDNEIFFNEAQTISAIFKY